MSKREFPINRKGLILFFTFLGLLFLARNASYPFWDIFSGSGEEKKYNRSFLGWDKSGSNYYVWINSVFSSESASPEKRREECRNNARLQAIGHVRTYFLSMLPEKRRATLAMGEKLEAYTAKFPVPEILIAEYDAKGNCDVLFKVAGENLHSLLLKGEL